jgi:hypothetical protein
VRSKVKKEKTEHVPNDDALSETLAEETDFRELTACKSTISTIPSTILMLLNALPFKGLWVVLM